LKNRFSRLGDVKIKERVSVGSQIRELIQHVKFKDRLSEVGKKTWEKFKYVTTNFGGNRKREHCRDMVVDLVQSYKAMGSDTSVSVYFLDSHLGTFP